jgi:hypothetical protein
MRQLGTRISAKYSALKSCMGILGDRQICSDHNWTVRWLFRLIHSEPVQSSHLELPKSHFCNIFEVSLMDLPGNLPICANLET